MKKQLLLTALLSASLLANAQNEKREKINEVSQVYYTVGADGKTKDGLYYIKNLTNDGLWLQGRYTKGQRTGTWFFFDGQKKLIARFNYDQKKFVYVDTAQLRNVDVRVVSNNPEIVKNASVPLPLCPVEYFTELATATAYKNYARRNEGFKTEITAHVDNQGRAYYTVVYIDGKRRTAPERLVLDIPFTLEWVPSLYDGKSVASEFTVFANVDPKTDEFRRFRWNN